MREEELARMGGDEAAQMRAFYETIKATRASHKPFAGAVATDGTEFIDELITKDLSEDVIFSGEEATGRYLDLHEAHMMYSNANFGERCDYGEYLERCGNFAATSRGKKFTTAYGTYLDGLIEYLRSFHARALPLQFVDKVLEASTKEFDEKWAKGECDGWEDKGVRSVDAAAIKSAVVDLSGYKTVDDMSKSLDVDAIKSALESMGLKAGGTPEQRAERLWSTKGKTLAELDKKLFAKGVVVGAKNAKATKEDIKAKEASARAVAFKEYQCATLLKLLSKQLDATRTNVEKKSTLSLAELQAEAEDDDDFSDAATDDEEEIYNPLKLPLGWDDKPIPYWLYKLHGLNMEFTCEICGNYSYWGRRAFERHFTEWRHQHGMRCLKIPFTRAFNEVTSINDALALHKNLNQREHGVWNTRTDEEVEDAEGNVYNKKTYQDLVRQGLI